MTYIQLLPKGSSLCVDCHSTGEIEQDYDRPHAFGPNEGFIDTRWVECDTCDGFGYTPPTLKNTEETHDA